MTVRPNDGCAILSSEAGQRPHHVDQIFYASLGSLPHVLVAVRILQGGACMNLNGLGKVELDSVSELQQYLFSEMNSLRIANEPLSRRRSFEQASQPLCPASIEVAVAERCRFKQRIEIGAQPANRFSIDSIPDYAKASPSELCERVLGYFCHAAARTGMRPTIVFGV